MKVTNEHDSEDGIHWHLALTQLDWRRRDLAERLGLARQTPYDWGKDAPRYALAYLELALAIKRHGDVLG